MMPEKKTTGEEVVFPACLQSNPNRPALLLCLRFMSIFESLIARRQGSHSRIKSRPATPVLELETVAT